MAETRQKAPKNGEKLVSLNCEVTAETKLKLVQLANGLDDGLSYGRTIAWLLNERERLTKSMASAVDLLHNWVHADTKTGEHKQAEVTNPAP
jgi:hypothetical protein